MCGDYGLPDELFQCDVCGFRSQHRYCSNLYPKAESYRVCNWCLSQTDHPMITEPTDPKLTQNSSTSSLASHRNDAEQEEDVKSINKKSRTKRPDDRDLVVQINGPDLKKQSKTPSPPSVVRKRIITRGALEERLRRTKSEEILNNNKSNKNSNINNNNNNKGIITKQVFRNKVRRYKLLEEVSS
ncbi:hypothetical protein CRG98_006129 [Punica granatum]|nr:hypothetical protein CRG98_006129 [Punica granatum]